MVLAERRQRQGGRCAAIASEALRFNLLSRGVSLPAGFSAQLPIPHPAGSNEVASPSPAHAKPRCSAGARAGSPKQMVLLHAQPAPLPKAGSRLLHAQQIIPRQQLHTMLLSVRSKWRAAQPWDTSPTGLSSAVLLERHIFLGFENTAYNPSPAFATAMGTFVLACP